MAFGISSPNQWKIVANKMCVQIYSSHGTAMQMTNY